MIKTNVIQHKLTYVNNKSNSFHSTSIDYIIKLAMKDQSFIVPSVIQHNSRLTI